MKSNTVISRNSFYYCSSWFVFHLLKSQNIETPNQNKIFIHTLYTILICTLNKIFIQQTEFFYKLNRDLDRL